MTKGSCGAGEDIAWSLAHGLVPSVTLNCSRQCAVALLSIGCLPEKLEKVTPLFCCALASYSLGWAVRPAGPAGLPPVLLTPFLGALFPLAALHHRWEAPLFSPYCLPLILMHSLVHVPSS